VLLQVMTLPVPPSLRAAASGTLAAYLLEASDARNLLARLAASPFADRARATAALSAQLAKAPAESAAAVLEEMSAYVRLLNRIVATGGADLVASEVDVLLPHTVCTPVAAQRIRASPYRRSRSRSTLTAR
jgi:hypothetical protein